MDDAHLAELQALVEPILTACEMELVELTCRPQGAQQLIRILVDKVGGVTLAECARANQRIGNALETAELIEGSYAIEVSSPGLDRPLVSRRDFERALGEELVVGLAAEGNRMKTLEGILLAVQPEAVVLKLPAGNVTVPFGEIRTAKKAIRW